MFGYFGEFKSYIKIVKRSGEPWEIDFAPDGSLFMADWVTGWNDKGYGRIWKLTDETAKGWALQKQTEAEIKADYKKLSEADLKSKLSKRSDELNLMKESLNRQIQEVHGVFEKENSSYLETLQ